MQKTLEIQVRMKRLRLSRTSVRALHNLNRYDLIVFTSKNARAFFMSELEERHIAAPRRARMVTVGPRHELLRLSPLGKRILFPRSAIAPYDIVRSLRARGAVVRVIPLYTTLGTPLSRGEKEALLRGAITLLYFRSPSGITGLLGQLSKKEKLMVRKIPAQCIGPTTARAAREAGFNKVSIKGVL
ncbi:MAG: uroporphyrinogen-III synthase/uroporphyrinogen-III C-methyltransferase [Parcubacteria group bacterium Gr01-1014_56]|nr:MAG: uroporphyrinogen-III synthase/uroporphyrinogen-III C-methyltransferase [Parcubacteria group bacterium Gr01-1014_56]